MWNHRKIDLEHYVEFDRLLREYKSLSEERFNKGNPLTHTDQLVDSVRKSVRVLPDTIALINVEMDSVLNKFPAINFDWNFDLVSDVTEGSWNIGGVYRILWYPRIKNYKLFIDMLKSQWSIDRKLTGLEIHHIGNIFYEKSNAHSYFKSPKGLRAEKRMANEVFRCHRWKAFELNKEELDNDTRKLVVDIISRATYITMALIGSIGDFHLKNYLSLDSGELYDMPDYKFPWD